MRTKTLVATLVIATALVTASCSGGSSDSSKTKDKPKATTTAPAVTTTVPPKPKKTNKITIDQYTFSPLVITIKAGTKVTVTNKDSTTHTFTSDDGSFDTGDLAPGESATVTVPLPKAVKLVKGAKKAIVGFHCEIHQTMRGSIIVNK